MIVTFEVLGIPSPQGSKRHVGGGIMIESSKTLATWRDSCTAAARTAANGRMFDEPVAVHVTFRSPMPRSRPAAVRRTGHAPKATAPDLDKMQRALGDALEASGLIRSDALICHWDAHKIEVIGWTGATITIEALAS